MRALLVEDDASFALLARHVLEQEGFAVDVASNGSDGLSLALVNEYDCVLLDLGLPDQHGITIIQTLRREGRTTPVMVLTGTAEGQTSVRALDAGADDYVTKPLMIDEFRARIRALIRAVARNAPSSSRSATSCSTVCPGNSFVDGTEVRSRRRSSPSSSICSCTATR